MAEKREWRVVDKDGETASMIHDSQEWADKHADRLNALSEAGAREAEFGPFRVEFRVVGVWQAAETEENTDVRGL